MVPFAGFEMPVRYTSQVDEHHAVRNSAGIFDVSHMGEFKIKGPQALDLIQMVTSNDASKLEIGGVQYSCLPNANGGIVDDLLVYRTGDLEYMLVVNASNIAKDWDWVSEHNSYDAEMIDVSDETSLLAVQGPNASKVIQALSLNDVSDMKYYTFAFGRFKGIEEEIIISATGYTGSGGFEIYVSNQHAVSVWNAIMEAGKSVDIQPAGLGARDTLRLEMGFALYGNDIDDQTSPISAGLGWITKFSKEFINSENLKKEKEAGPESKLIGFKMTEKGIPRSGYEIIGEGDVQIGTVTSGTMSPSLGYGIGLGYVNTPLAKAGSTIYISVRNRRIPAEITKLPFYKAKK